MCIVLRCVYAQFGLHAHIGLDLFASCITHDKIINMVKCNNIHETVHGTSKMVCVAQTSLDMNPNRSDSSLCTQSFKLVWTQQKLTF